MRSKLSDCLFVCVVLCAVPGALLCAAGPARADEKAVDDKAADEKAVDENTVDEKNAESQRAAGTGATEEHEGGTPVVLILGRDLGLDPGRRKELRQALSFELGIRSLALVEPGTGAGEDADALPQKEPVERERNARRRMIESSARAALWLEAGYAGPVSWLRVVTDRDERVHQAPLPHPPHAIDPRLFGIAAASLLEQVLEKRTREEPAAAAPEVAGEKGEAPPARSRPQQVATGPARIDDELAARPEPPERIYPHAAEKRQKRFFANIGLVLGVSVVHSGMEVDWEPPDREQNVYVMDPDSDQYLTLRNDTPWVADADSWERNPDGIPGTDTAFQKNPSQECPADGRVSGPDQQAFVYAGYPYYPTSYCARVDSAGLVVSSPAMRVEIGYYVLPRLSVAAILRYQFSAGEGALSHWLLGGRVGYLLTAPESRLSWTVFGGVTTGQIQAQASAPPGSADLPLPWIVSGPTGLHAGSAVGWWFDEHFGVQLAPEIDVQLSRTLWNLDINGGLMTRF